MEHTDHGCQRINAEQKIPAPETRPPPTPAQDQILLEDEAVEWDWKIYFRIWVKYLMFAVTTYTWGLARRIKLLYLCEMYFTCGMKQLHFQHDLPMLSDLSRCVMFRWIHVKRQVLKFKYGHPLSLARRFIIIVELDDECCKSSRFICPHTAMQVNSIVARCFRCNSRSTIAKSASKQNWITSMTELGKTWLGVVVKLEFSPPRTKNAADSHQPHEISTVPNHLLLTEYITSTLDWNIL